MAEPEAQSPSTVDLLVVLTRVETKLDTVMTTQGDHETRLRALERLRWPLGSVMALAAIAALVVPYVHHP